MLLSELLQWIMMVSLLVYIPIVCYLDLKHREVQHNVWNPLAFISIICMGDLIVMGIYEWWMFVIPAVAIIMLFVSMKLHYIEGADFIYLSFISLCFMFNPISGHWFMTLSFFIMFAAMCIVTGGYIMWWNFLKGEGLTFKFENGIPMMLPISIALIFTVVLA